MRLFRTLPFLGLLAGARASSLDGRDPQPHPLDTRALIDVCAALDVDLKLDVLGIVIVVGVLDVCICISALPLFIETNAVAIAGVALAGEDAVIAAITALINENAPKSHCTYPEHAVPACIGKNPCGFTCKDGFTPEPPKNPTACVCEPPNTVCNGVCGPSKSCPSAKPISKREKRWTGSGACNMLGEGHMACGVFGGGARAWECVDTYSDLESCGGCTLPLTPYTPVGMDCSALPGVADVSCLSGQCIVHRCLPGYSRAKDASHCLHAGSSFTDDDQGIPAVMYGLEHQPLKH